MPRIWRGGQFQDVGITLSGKILEIIEHSQVQTKLTFYLSMQDKKDLGIALLNSISTSEIDEETIKKLETIINRNKKKSKQGV